MSDHAASSSPQPIPRIPESVRNAARQGKLVIFVGAGVSRLVGGPSWDQLAHQLLQQLNELNCLSFAEWQQLGQLDAKKRISIAVDIFEDRQCQPDFAKILHPAYPVGSKTKVYQDLYSIGTPFVTTNYDLHLDHLTELPLVKPRLEGIEEPGIQKQQKTTQLQSKNRVFFRKRDLTIDKLTKGGDVIHLHGSLKDPKSLILTTRQYLEHYEDEGVRIFLRELFARYTVLFIGYGLEEEEILEHIFRKRASNSGETHYRLFPRFSYESSLYNHLSKYYSSHCDVELVEYSIDHYGHNQLMNVISEWARQLSSEVQEAGFLDKVRIIDEALSG
jgi:SIR2-like domain